MVILKLNPGTDTEHEVEIVNEKGTWESGNYLVFKAHFMTEGDVTPEPHNINSPNFLGEINIDKKDNDPSWQYNGDKLPADEQKQVAEFILDYQVPDAVY